MSLLFLAQLVINISLLIVGAAAVFCQLMRDFSSTIFVFIGFSKTLTDP